jgi:hypothetical protein
VILLVQLAYSEVQRRIRRVTVPKDSTSAEGWRHRISRRCSGSRVARDASVSGANYIGFDRSLQRVGLVNNPKAATPQMTSRRTMLANREIQPFISCMTVIVFVGAAWDDGGRARAETSAYRTVSLASCQQNMNTNKVLVHKRCHPPS